MNDFFTIEEINLICIYSGIDRIKAIEGIADAMPDKDYDQDMLELACTTLKKLSVITDEEFSDMNLTPAWDEDEVYVEVPDLYD